MSVQSAQHTPRQLSSLNAKMLGSCINTSQFAPTAYLGGSWLRYFATARTSALAYGEEWGLSLRKGGGKQAHGALASG